MRITTLEATGPCVQTIVKTPDDATRHSRCKIKTKLGGARVKRATGQVFSRRERTVHTKEHAPTGQDVDPDARYDTSDEPHAVDAEQTVGRFDAPPASSKITQTFHRASFPGK